MSQPLQIGDHVTPFSTIEATDYMDTEQSFTPGVRFEIVRIKDGLAYLARPEASTREWTQCCQLCDLERW